MAGRDRTSRGQGLVEFALVFPVIALLFFGVFDLGRAVFAYSTIANAARQGARVAVVNQLQVSPECSASKPVEDPNNPHWSIKTCAASAAISLGVTAADVTVSYAKPAGSALECSSALHVGCIATVTVHYHYLPMTPIFSSIFPSMAMDSTSQMPIERVFP
jgi:hypothetical protein